MLANRSRQRDAVRWGKLLGMDAVLLKTRWGHSVLAVQAVQVPPTTTATRSLAALVQQNGARALVDSDNQVYRLAAELTWRQHFDGAAPPPDACFNHATVRATARNFSP